MTTWVLFALQHVYFGIYIGLESSLHSSQTALSFIVLLHIAFSVAVIKLAHDETRCDASYVSAEKIKILKEIAQEQNFNEID